MSDWNTSIDKKKNDVQGSTSVAAMAGAYSLQVRRSNQGIVHSSLF